MGGHLDNNAGSKTRSGKIESSSTSGRKTRLDDLDLDLVAAESTVAAGAETSTGDDGDVPRYHIPYPFAFNGGKPFSLEKDPITGKIDFEKAPPVKALNYTDRYREREDKESEDGDDGGGEKSAYAGQEKSKDGHDVGPNEINTYTPNFHDFLNLPVHYSSDKYGNDKYPLISSSYANTKVQSGANSYSTYNHRPYHLENDLYVRPVKNSHPPITKTSTYRTTIVDDLKAKWTSTTNPSTITTSASPISSRTTLSISTKAPVVTTWKPSSTPITFHSIDRTEIENEKNLLPIEKLHASGHAESHRNPSDGTTEKVAQVATHYKDQPNLNNFVVSHAKPETKPSAQNEEYKDSYDTYESDGEGDGDSEENDYFLPFGDLLKEIVTSAPSTTASSTMTSTTTTSTTTMVTTASTAETTTSTTVAPTRSVSSTMSTMQEEVPANKPLQFPISQHPVVSSSLNNDRRPEHYDNIMSHGYRPSPIKSDGMGAGIVIESTSNIVIPPDQDTVSFVLGNRQNVDGGYYSVGTAVGENPYGGSETDAVFWPLRNDPHEPTKEVKHEHLPASVTEPNPDRVTQKWWPPSPSPLKSNNELDPTRSQNPLVAITGTVVLHDTKSPSKKKDSSYIIFPNDETKNKDTLTEEHIVIINEADGSIRELPPKTTLTTTSSTATNKTKLNLPADDIIGDLPQLAEDLVPPAENSRLPSYYYHYQFDTTRPNHSRPQRLPLPPRIKPHSGPPVSPLDVRKRPYSPDTKLPNILPQFRPNAKASHGHRDPDVIGTMPAGQGASTRIRQPLPAHPSRRPLPPPPSYLQRLNPPPPPIHAVRLTSKVDSVVLPHETEPTIRKLRPPHAIPSISRGSPEENAPSNRLFVHGNGGSGDGEEGEIANRKIDRGKSEITNERESEGSERYPEEPPMTPPRSPLFPKRRTADPLRIATLQMIQHHGEFGNDGDEGSLTQPVEPVLAHEAERRKSNNPSEIPEQPVYVVYPVNTAVNIHPDDSNEKDGSVVVGTRGPQRPLPPDTLLQNEQDDTHTVYNGRPVALDFPYPLERPDPSSVFPVVGVKETPVLIPSEQRQQQQQQQQQASAAIANEQENEKNDAVNVIPYLQDFLPYRKKNEAAISVTLHRTAPIATSSSSSTSTSTSTPIAYVYTPTYAPYPAHHLDEDLDDDDDASIDVKQTVLLPSQQPSSSSSSAPAPQNFMAPFVASMSAEAPSKNGWSVVVVETPAGAERKSDNDSDEAKLPDSENDTQTERNEFDADNFKPQLFSGFKPLYEFPTEDIERHDVADTDTEINMPRHAKKLLPVPDKE